jgi:hypothetical protein
VILETRHPGPHSALGQQGIGVEWWLHWTTQASEPEIVETHICPVERDTLVNTHGEHEPLPALRGAPGPALVRPGLTRGQPGTPGLPRLVVAAGASRQGLTAIPIGRPAGG